MTACIHRDDFGNEDKPIHARNGYTFFSHLDVDAYIIRSLHWK